VSEPPSVTTRCDESAAAVDANNPIDVNMNAMHANNTRTISARQFYDFDASQQRAPFRKLRFTGCCGALKVDHLQGVVRVQN
jgi:hypothetical protein